jgi:hypothetical protein
VTFRGILRGWREQVIADEDAGQMHVGTHRAKLRFDLAVVHVQLVELRIDFLRPLRCGEHRKHHNEQDAGQAHGGHRPRPKPHPLESSEDNCQPNRFPLSMASRR